MTNEISSKNKDKKEQTQRRPLSTNLTKIFLYGFTILALVFILIYIFNNPPYPQKEPILSVDPSRLYFEGYEDASITDKSLNISNAGGDILEWSLTSEPWIKLSRTSGSDSARVGVSILGPTTPGTRYGTIAVHSNGGDKNIAVEVKVLDRPTTTAHPPQITDVFWLPDDRVIGISFDEFPSEYWNDWRMYIDGDPLPVDALAGEPNVRPNDEVQKATGLFIGTVPWLSSLDEVDFPCCGTIKFYIPGMGYTNEFEFNLVEEGCKTGSDDFCPRKVLIT